MFRPLLVLTLSLLELVPGIKAAAFNDGQQQFCADINWFLNIGHEQQAATAFCTSYLRISPVTTTTTLTSIESITETVATTVTHTSVSTRSTELTVIATAISSVEVDVTTVSTQYFTPTVVESVFSTTTETVASMSTFTSTVTETIKSEAVSPLTQCTAPSQAAKRNLRQWEPSPTPQCWSGYKDQSILSEACDCLCLTTPTSTRTVSVYSTHTAVKHITRTAVQSLQTAITITTFGTKTEIDDVTSIISLDDTITVPTTVSTILAVTTTVTTPSTTTTIVTTTVASATRYVNFALLDSQSLNYGLLRSAGASGPPAFGRGVYFSGSGISGAAGFSIADTDLYNDGNLVGFFSLSGPALTLSGGEYLVPETQGSGTALGCTLTTGGASGLCPLSCMYSGISGNTILSEDLESYDGFYQGPLWALAGSQDQFTVYAVGMTT